MKKLICTMITLVLLLAAVCAASAETIQAKPATIDINRLEGRMVKRHQIMRLTRVRAFRLQLRIDAVPDGKIMLFAAPRAPDLLNLSAGCLHFTPFCQDPVLCVITSRRDHMSMCEKTSPMLSWKVRSAQSSRPVTSRLTMIR